MRVQVSSISAFDGVLYLRALRRINQRSTIEIARAAGISTGRLNGIERGLVEPTAEERERLAAVFGVRASRLFQVVTVDINVRKQDFRPPENASA